MVWYIPSFYGDIRLTKTADEQTIISWEKTTAAEQSALKVLAKKFQRWDPRPTPESIPSRDPHLATPRSPTSGLFEDAEGAVVLDAALEKVRAAVARALKPGRQVVDVVMFSDGKIFEDSKIAPRGDPAAGLTVARPHLGCPEPRMANAEVRARRVLQVFSSPEQQEDFAKYNAFVSVGSGTGHRYMVTSRHSRGRLATYRRQLYDLDERRAYCVHDYSVPAAEEMLALHVLLQIPEHEHYLRHLD
jgi:hypothetical protein